jgi:aconitase A
MNSIGYSGPLLKEKKQNCQKQLSTSSQNRNHKSKKSRRTKDPLFVIPEMFFAKPP